MSPCKANLVFNISPGHETVIRALTVAHRRNSDHVKSFALPLLYGIHTTRVQYLYFFCFLIGFGIQVSRVFICGEVLTTICSCLVGLYLSPQWGGCSLNSLVEVLFKVKPV